VGIVGQIDENEVFGPINQLGTQVVVFAALLVMFTIFVSSFMAELFVRPILGLAGAAGKLRRGDFSARAKVLSHDEIGQLGVTFNNMAEDLAKQDQAKSDVIALISHQLRTPVTAVKGFVSLVLQDKKRRLTDEETKMLKLAFEENEKLNALITQILDVAHADAGKLAIKKQSTDLVELAQKVVKDHRSALKLRGQTIGFTPPSSPFVAAVDPEKIGFVLGNLLTNASKYSPSGSKIAVTMGQDKRNYWIKVTDYGLGISHADQRKLFQKFSRIENPKRETAEGMGLGLFMAKKIVELHKGDLTVSSRENVGSSFTIELPIND
jgi:two-component system sensor histidine kinase BaeS